MLKYDKNIKVISVLKYNKACTHTYIYAIY